MPTTARRPPAWTSYEALIARSAPMPDAMREQRRPRRHLLHRRHHRPLQGRDAQPRQSDGQCAERARRRPAGRAARSICMPRRCSTSPTGAAMYRAAAERRHATSIIPAFTPDGVLPAIAARPRHRRAAGADHDPDAGRPSRRSAPRPVVAAAHRVRRLADQRGGARARDEGAARVAVHRRPTA